MIINRRTSFTDLEYPNPFEDPGWSTYDSIPNKTLSIAAAPGQTLTYKVPDGASGWYAMRVIADDSTNNASAKTGSWHYTYLHEGSVVFLWCNNGTTRVSRKSLGANSGNAGLGGAAGIVCGFKQSDDISANNYGPYVTAKPVKVVSGLQTYKQWGITLPGGRKITRYTRGTGVWDNTNSARSAIYMLIDGKPCYSFEDGASIFDVPGATVTAEPEFVSDGIYLGTTPIEFDKSAFTLASGLIVGSSGSPNINGSGGGALGSAGVSGSVEGALLTFGQSATNLPWGGIARFDFTRNVFDGTGPRLFEQTGESAGAYLYKITEDGHDYSEPYAQIFTAGETIQNATYSFEINGTPYVFPSDWPDANKQKANSGDYVTYIQNVHIGDTLTVTVRYADNTSTTARYIISMHSLVYGLFLRAAEVLFEEGGSSNVSLLAGRYYAIIHGAGGAGGDSGTTGSSSGTCVGGTGGAGGTGEVKSKIFDLPVATSVYVHVGRRGKTVANGGNGGLAGYTNGDTGNGGAGGGGAEPSYITVNGVTTFAEGGGGGGGGGGAGTSPVIRDRYNGGAGSGGGGGYYRCDETPNTPKTKRDIYLNIVQTDGLYYFEETTSSAAQMAIHANENIQLYSVFTGTSVGGDTYEITVMGISGTTMNISGVLDIYGGGLSFVNIEPTDIEDALTEQGAMYISVPGQNGVDGAGLMTGTNGTAGNTTDFPNIYSGGGGRGANHEAQGSDSAGANGGGASGGSGGGANWNTDWATGGAGGGGAGGSYSAGGGQGGEGSKPGYNASNVRTTPESTINYLEETVTTHCGVGGLPGYDGFDGYVYITEIRPETAFLDYGALFVSGGVSYYDTYTEVFTSIDFGEYGHNYRVKQPATVGEKLFRPDWSDTGYTITSVVDARRITATPTYTYRTKRAGFTRQGASPIFMSKLIFESWQQDSVASNFPTYTYAFDETGEISYGTVYCLSQQDAINGIVHCPGENGSVYNRDASLDFTLTSQRDSWEKTNAAPVEKEDEVPATIDETIDCGSVADSTSETKNYGKIIEKE